jgi:WD40 repeat protein
MVHAPCCCPPSATLAKSAARAKRAMSDSGPRVSTAFPSLNEAPHQLAVLEHEGGTLLALGTGCYVAVVSGELCEVVQLVGPHAEPVSCADWFRAGCGASLAVGAGCTVSFYSDLRGGAERWVVNGMAAHDQPVHALKWAGSAVWTAAGCALALWACSDDLWSKQWSCNLSQPAELMALSADGALLATAGRFDRLVKVWHRTQDEFTFSYLHHPHGLQSIEWRPPAIEPGPCGASGRNVLLTLCRDGVARLWSSTHAPERELHV